MLAVPAESHFPVAVIAAHGLLAGATMVLVLLTALGVGGAEAAGTHPARLSRGPCG